MRRILQCHHLKVKQKPLSCQVIVLLRKIENGVFDCYKQKVKLGT